MFDLSSLSNVKFVALLEVFRALELFSFDGTIADEHIVFAKGLIRPLGNVGLSSVGSGPNTHTR